jgi:hypothetical protein
MYASAGGSLLATAAEPPKNQFYEMQYFHMKTGPQMERSNEFFGKYYMPAITRLGAPPVGFFSPVIGEQSPYLLMLVSHANWESVEKLNARLRADAEYTKGFEAYLAGEPPYVRRESSLLKAFDSIPVLQVPAAKPGRIFELRTYESNTSLSLQRKIKMFGDGEIGIFKRLGMMPVFFGQTLFGRNIPNLTYMLAFDDLAHREKLWKDFGSDPEWQKMKSAPGLADAEIVSNISNTILRPMPYSQIK